MSKRSSTPQQPAPGLIPIGHPVSQDHHVITGKRTVALLDILGFKEWIASEPLEVIARKYEDAVHDLQFLNKPRPPVPDRFSMFPDHPIDVPFCKTFIFSDSIIMISNGPGASETLKTAISAWRTLQAFIFNRIPARGAVTFGEMYINPSRNIFLGPALTQAAQLEKKQEWIGAIVDENVMREISGSVGADDAVGKLLAKIFRKYPVPFKDGNSPELHTLNWRACSVINGGVRTLFAPNPNAAVQLKYSHTLEYCEGATIQAPNPPVELATAWIGGPPFKDPDFTAVLTSG